MNYATRAVPPHISVSPLTPLSLSHQVIDELMDENIHILISKHAKLLGKPNCGTTSDVWSMKSCRESFACICAARSYWTATCSRS